MTSTELARRHEAVMRNAPDEPEPPVVRITLAPSTPSSVVLVALNPTPELAWIK